PCWPRRAVHLWRRGPGDPDARRAPSAGWPGQTSAAVRPQQRRRPRSGLPRARRPTPEQVFFGWHHPDAPQNSLVLIGAVVLTVWPTPAILRDGTVGGYGAAD